MNSRTLLVGLFAGAMVLAAFAWSWNQRNGPERLVNRGRELSTTVAKVTEPMTSSLRNFNPVLPVAVRKKEIPSVQPAIITRPTMEPEKRFVPPLTIVAAEPQADKPDPPTKPSVYAPAFRLVKCQLVNTVDSSNVTTPIIGLVTEDVCWNGKVIIPANSEVHGTASVDAVRERIASEGEFTFVLSESDRRGRELVVRGMVLDMERNDSLDTYGITDGSAGLRGDVIRTANSDVIKLYAASLISGIAGAFSSGSSGLLGNRVFTNNSSIGLSALQNGVVNPAVGGTQSVLDRYADQIAQSIQRDGFFVRVPAGKQFYVYCTEAIDLGRAKVGADDERENRASIDLERKAREEVRRAFPVDTANLLSPLLPALNSQNNNTK
jgi:hypothetical protein